MHILKHIPADFIVDEVSTVSPSSVGNYLYFLLWKKDLTTFHALKLVASSLHLPLKAIGFAGNKDRRAVTTQVCSVKNFSKDKLDVDIENISLTFLGFGSWPVFVGALKGNNFKITVRNIESLPEINSRFRNLFGEQRFSSRNAEVGRFIIKKDFESAAKLLAEISPNLINDDLLERKQWISAIRSFPRQQLLLFLHAYQSLLWNRAALKSDKKVLPIVGFGTEDLDSVTKEVLAEENLSLSDFVIREIPELSLEGTSRRVFAEAENLNVSELQDDEFFPGKKKAVLSFFLSKGSYATEFIRQLFQRQ